MPPSIPIPVSQSLVCLLKRQSSSTTPASIPIRSFSTSTALFSIGPESPKFIDVPLPPQRFLSRPRDVKGKLPTPRDVFHRRGPTKNGQTLRQHLAHAAREPRRDRPQPEPANERVAWKQRLAASRRQNLREGLFALQHRQKNRLYALSAKSQRAQQDRDTRLNAPQREDERLTNPTVPQALLDGTSGLIPDPQREARIAEMMARVEAHEKSRKDARMDALHTLYMNARSFIVTEEQLDAKIDQLFVIDPFGKNPAHPSVWEAYGRPETVESMLQSVNHTEKSALKYAKGQRPAYLTGLRLKKIAEELTGGKMD